MYQLSKKNITISPILFFYLHNGQKQLAYLKRCFLRIQRKHDRMIILFYCKKLGIITISNLSVRKLTKMLKKEFTFSLVCDKLNKKYSKQVYYFTFFPIFHKNNLNLAFMKFNLWNISKRRGNPLTKIPCVLYNEYKYQRNHAILVILTR